VQTGKLRGGGRGKYEKCTKTPLGKRAERTFTIESQTGTISPAEKGAGEKRSKSVEKEKAGEGTGTVDEKLQPPLRKNAYIHESTPEGTVESVSSFRLSVIIGASRKGLGPCRGQESINGNRGKKMLAEKRAKHKKLPKKKEEKRGRSSSKKRWLAFGSLKRTTQRNDLGEGD